ncbi:ferritin-like domain-containing protein [Zavarzinia sp. CC-PAN008]|uniref:ferritin-like domain-containing protein n=1 Tax=Zavarzinia sp. CC-PAN008 TaxID=3243332 RepID=UPI003F7498C3
MTLASPTFAGAAAAAPRIGTAQHKHRFCQDFIDSHQTFVPAELPWPDLDDAALARLRSVPFWQEVLHTERRAGMIVAAFAETVTDPELRHAIQLQGVEEARHAELLRVMIERYGVEVEEQPVELPDMDVETAFMDFGYGECLDAFLGFGVFKIARESEFLPPAMFDIFENLMHEETRHIVFFINWMAWQEAQAGRGWRRGLTSLQFYGRAGQRLLGTVRRGQDQNDGKDFSATQASVFLDGFTFERFLEDCHSENARRMSQFGDGLLRPALLPGLAGYALRALRLWKAKRPHLPDA